MHPCKCRESENMKQPDPTPVVFANAKGVKQPSNDGGKGTRSPRCYAAREDGVGCG